MKASPGCVHVKFIRHGKEMITGEIGLIETRFFSLKKKEEKKRERTRT